MKSKFNQRWLITATIWATALIMTYWNFSKVDQVARIHETSEQLRKENAFQHRNASKLQQVQKMYATHFKTVASPKLGFESVRNSLLELAALLDLKDIIITNRLNEATENQMPFNVKMIGNYVKSAEFVSALRRYPYLSITRSRILVVNVKGDSEINLDLVFKFNVKSPDTNETEALQASFSPSAQRGQIR